MESIMAIIVHAIAIVPILDIVTMIASANVNIAKHSVT
jgi:hypothetical protein